MKTLPDKGVIIRCVTTDQKVVGSTPAERTNDYSITSNGLCEIRRGELCWRKRKVSHSVSHLSLVGVTHSWAWCTSFFELLNPSGVVTPPDSLIQLLTVPWIHGQSQKHQECFVNWSVNKETSGCNAFLMPYTTSRKALVVKPPYTNTSPRLLNADEVAENLGVSKSSVQRLIKTGQITSLKIGSSRRVSEQSLTNYITKLESQFKQEFREAIS